MFNVLSEQAKKGHVALVNFNNSCLFSKQERVISDKCSSFIVFFFHFRGRSPVEIETVLYLLFFIIDMLNFIVWLQLYYAAVIKKKQL